jgi:hypothetical protein
MLCEPAAVKAGWVRDPAEQPERVGAGGLRWSVRLVA